MSDQFLPLSSPQFTHCDLPGIIVPPSTTTLSLPCRNPVPSSSPCQECAIHDTILQSMRFNMRSMDCAISQQLYVNPSCSRCYSGVQLQHHDKPPDDSSQTRCDYAPQSSGSYPHGNTAQISNVNGRVPNLQYYNRLSQSRSHCFPSPINFITSQTCLSSPTVPVSSITSCRPRADLQRCDPLSRSGMHLSGDDKTVTEARLKHLRNGHSSVLYPETEIPAFASGNEPANGFSSKNVAKADLNQDNNRDQSQNYKGNFQKVSSNKRKNENVGKRITDARKRQPADLCAVCGDKASGYHYNALTCEGCKGFFRRSITNKLSHKQRCRQSGTCEMDLYTRRKCPHCRLKKCKEVGMLEECLLTEIQCQAKRRRRKPKQHQKQEKAMVLEEMSQSTNVSSPTPLPVVSSPSGSESSQNGNMVLFTLTEEETKVIETVSEAFKSYNISEEIVWSWEKYINNESKTTCRLSDITTVHVQVLVEFAKNIPGFITLDPEDQIALLKGSVFEAMLLRNSCGYHHLRREINKSAILDELGIEENKLEALLYFFNCIGKLGMDKIEYALLIAIVIFNSDYPFVKNKKVVEEMQDLYLSVLAKYSLRKPQRPSILARILAMLTEIRSLSHFNAEVVTSWKKRGALTPLLCEIWDLE